MIRQIKRSLALLLAAGLLLGCCACGKSLQKLTVTFFKVGKADAAVLRCGGQTLIIDAGETDDGDELVEYLQKEGVTAVDVLLISHFDQDHVGGAAALLANLQVKRVITPAYVSDSNEYQTFTMMAFAVQLEPETLTSSCSFSLGDCKVLVEPPADYSIAGTSDDADNELSLITTVTHGDVRLLFTGDAENVRLAEWLRTGAAQPCDLIKMPHHGVYANRQKDLLAAVTPKYAVICDSEKNPADQKTLSLLADAGAAVYETKNGDITAESDGKTLTVRQ